MLVQYVIRHLEPKQNGNGKIVFAFSAPEDFGLKDAQEAWPEKFAKPGFYSLMQATGQTIMIEPEKAK